MKKLITTLMLTIAPAVVPATALALDATPLFSVNIGAGSWGADYSGELGDFNTDVDDLGFDDDDNTYFYVAFEHAVPVIPQVRFERIGISTSGVGTLTRSFQIDDRVFTVGSEVASDLDLTFNDLVLYYELAVFDFGLTFRQFDAEVAAATTDGSLSDNEEVDGVLPMAYLQTKIDLPLTGVYVTGSVNGISFDDKSVIDYRAAVGYEIDLALVSKLGLEIGYRNFELDLGDEEDFAADIELSGVYFGVNLKF